ncbi:MAG: twin-arginine translocase TatA/TatE family subunit [Sedimenticola sp.]|nr:twin-arginine translocase TatA/TatE family subunit [Sedimenticola sp.]
MLFGTKRLKNIGSDLGNAVKGFKGAMSDEKKNDDSARLEKADEEKIIEGEVTKKEDSSSSNKS